MDDDFDFDDAYDAADQNADAWKAGLSKTGDGVARKNLYNACVALRDHPVTSKTIGYDEFAGCVWVLGALPWDNRQNRAWTEFDDIKATEWLQSAAVGINVGSNIVREAVQAVAYERRFHPVLEWLEALQWDKEERLNAWLSKYLGVQETPLFSAIGRAFLISAVARIQKPGCKVDHMLILEGAQGILKSTALRALVGNDSWFSDQISDLGTKDSYQDLRGKWIIEISELDAMRRQGEVERVKAYVSRQIDHYRPSYGRRSGDVARQCVFIGSTNAEEYLSDSTGGRRFWPVACGALDIDGLARDRHQLWAEAVVAYHAGERWWIEDTDLKRLIAEEQEARRLPHPWEAVIAEWLNSPTKAPDRDGFRAPLDIEDGKVTTAQILEHAIVKPVERQTTSDLMAVGKILKLLGWKKRKAGKANRVVWERGETAVGSEDEVSAQGVSPETSGNSQSRTLGTPETPLSYVRESDFDPHKGKGVRGVSGVSPTNGSDARERIGSCAYCRDAAYSDDATITPAGPTVHHRCVDVWRRST